MPISNDNKIGIVILNYKNWQVTVRCINSIGLIKKINKIEIVVIDNGSNNNSEEHIRKYTTLPIKFISLPKNIGFARANNIGVNWCEKQ